MKSSGEVEDATKSRLILMRHAKSSWADGTIADHDRPLNDRGRRATPLIAGWLIEHAYQPDRILSSTSLRTRSTVELLIESGVPLPSIEWIPELYLASPRDILKIVEDWTVPDDRTVMVVGHNPGMEILASMLAGQAIEMPTGAVAIFECPSETWAIPIDSGEVKFVDFMAPRELDS